jgi:hypothetical protein
MGSRTYRGRDSLGRAGEKVLGALSCARTVYRQSSTGARPCEELKRKRWEREKFIQHSLAFGDRKCDRTVRKKQCRTAGHAVDAEQRGECASSRGSTLHLESSLQE